MSVAKGRQEFSTAFATFSCLFSNGKRKCLHMWLACRNKAEHKSNELHLNFIYGGSFSNSFRLQKVFVVLAKREALLLSLSIQSASLLESIFLPSIDFSSIHKAGAAECDESSSRALLSFAQKKSFSSFRRHSRVHIKSIRFFFSLPLAQWKSKGLSIAREVRVIKYLSSLSLLASLIYGKRRRWMNFRCGGGRGCHWAGGQKSVKSSRPTGESAYSSQACDEVVQ